VTDCKAQLKLCQQAGNQVQPASIGQPMEGGPGRFDQIPMDKPAAYRIPERSPRGNLQFVARLRC
jgi:hypothetical protein